MPVRTQLTHYLHAMARYVDDPKLLAMRRRSIQIDTYHSLNQPWFRQLQIKTVLDIGANKGYFTRTMMALLPHARIYAFEPLPDCFAEMQRLLEGATKFTAFNVGLGDEQGELPFERNAFAPSSSFLNITDKHYGAFPYTRDSETLTVRVERLDDMARVLELDGPLMVKIDVQGYEHKVLRGGEETIKRSRLLIVETSFEELYEGQPLFGEVYRLLSNWGFEYRGALDQLVHPQDGRVLQADCIFVKG